MLFNFLLTIFLLYFLILLPMSCAICGFAFAEEDDVTPENTFVLFKSDTKFADKNKDGAGDLKNMFKSFTSPSLSYYKDVLVIFAQATNNNGDPKTCDIVEGYMKFTSGNVDDLDRAFVKTSNEDTWKKRIVVENGGKCKGSPTTAVNNTHIYVFLNSTNTVGDKFSYEVISNNGVSDVNNGIKWDSSTDLTQKIKTVITKASKDADFIASGGSGVIFDSTFVVPLWYTKESKDYVLFNFNVSETDSKWNSLLSEHPAEGKYPAIIEWNRKLIMMTSNKEGFRKVYEFAEIGKKWTEAVGSLSAVWGNTDKRTPSKYGGQWGFITADIGEGGEKVIFVTQPVINENNNKYKLHLWMTDYQRVYDVGAISAEIGEDTSSTLLYAQGNLFAAYEKLDNDDSTIHAVYLKKQLDKAKQVLKKWSEKDDELSKSCFAEDLTSIIKEKCTNNISIKGLVGFLSNGYKDKKWGNQYLCVDAIVKNDKQNKVTNMANGLKFSGAGAGATWPVGAQGQNQRYHFVNYGFTLFATVKIDNDTNEKNSVLGFGFEKDNKKSIGLLCSNGKWSVSDEKGTAKETTNAETCVKDGIYQVALILDQSTFSVYIGKKELYQINAKTITAINLRNINYFFFGADTDTTESTAFSKSFITVTNVFLYNRPFENNEIDNLRKQIKKPVSAETPVEVVETSTHEDERIPTPLPQGTDKNTKSDEKDEKAPSPSRTGDGGVGGGVRVFSLLLAVLCVSAPLLHL